MLTESCYPVLVWTKGSSWSLYCLFPPSMLTRTRCANGLPVYVWVWRRVSPRWKGKTVLYKIQTVVFSALTPENATKVCGVNKYSQASLTREKLPARPASTVAHAAFQDLLSCGQRPRSQTPGTLTYTRRPAARHSQRIRPITTRALLPRHRQPPGRVGRGGARWLAAADPVGQWRPACIVRPPMGRLGEATHGSGSKWSYV